MDLMSTKIVFTDEQKSDIVSMYAQSKTLKDIAIKYNCYNTTIRKLLKKLQVYRPGIHFYKKKCVICGKTFLAMDIRNKYCNNPCSNRYIDGSYAQQKSLRYHYINTIRSMFWHMLKSNPQEALELEMQMEKEEGKEFKDMVLGGITKTPEFNKLMKIYNKYKMAFGEVK